jgi:transcription elongation factor SPT6
VALAFNDPEGVPVAPVNPEGRPHELAQEFSGPGTPFTDPEIALKGESPIVSPIKMLTGIAASKILATEFFKDPSIRQQARDFMEACAVVSVEPTDKGQIIIDQFHLYSVRQLSQFSPKTRKADP